MFVLDQAHLQFCVYNSEQIHVMQCYWMLLEMYCFSNRKPIKLQISMVDKGNDTGFFRNVRKSSHERLYDKRAEGDNAATKIVWVV